MSDPILHPQYWKGRLQTTKRLGRPQHHSIFICSSERWERIEAKHREILARYVGWSDSVLDAGCGYGRLITLLPPGWRGEYLGIDLSPDFVELAQTLHPRLFMVGDLRDLSPLGIGEKYDWAVMISIRPMVRRNCGGEVWDQMEAELRRVARRLLFLEYDENDEGSIE